MKFVAIILLLLTSIFLIACSANQASNKTSNSELENLASKYGGGYIFNQKFVEEIDIREKERSDYMDDFFKNNKRNFKRDDLAIMDKKLPQILSNGKPYYQRRNYSKKVVIPDDVVVKLKNFMGETAYKLSSIIIDEFYFDNENLKVISLDVSFYEGYTKYGLFGDEGRGFSLSRKDIKDISGNNKFYFDSHKNTFVREK
ncbi:tRNA 2-selenouridine synthase [Campylobacter concisus]|uniref:tRNA 2-selenouridine synthase n=1 Tax=Campylobacter concisus TaxID=199 RepID=UPI000CD80B6D|nr:tRNA 2-selenouridine synthase [Campylobacter concisus]